MDTGYTIRLARADDIDALPGIERAASQLFAAWGWDDDLLASVTPPDVLRAALAVGRLWIAADADDRPVGFAMASIVAGRWSSASARGLPPRDCPRSRSPPSAIFPGTRRSTSGSASPSCRRRRGRPACGPSSSAKPTPDWTRQGAW